MRKWYTPFQKIWRTLDYRLGSKRHKLKCDFRKFEANIHQDQEFYAELQKWAEMAANKSSSLESRDMYENAPDNIVLEGFHLRQSCFSLFRGRCKGSEPVRFLLHCPPSSISPAANSLVRNWADGMEFLGIPVRLLHFDDDVTEVFEEFQPDALLTTDSVDFIQHLDWNRFAEYKKTHRFLVGMSAIPGVMEGRPLADRLAWARDKGVDFYYCYSDLEYCRQEYREFLDAGYPVIGIPFSANPLHYYPVPDVKRDLDFVFLASVNMDKWNRYIPYLGELVKLERGLLMGPGWKHYATNDINPDRDRYLYARAKVGLNLHLDFQLKGANELNERTYMLAACGTPQLVDYPGLLDKHFDEDCFFVGRTPEEYNIQYGYIISNPHEAERKSLNAMRQVFREHTIFHRMEQLSIEVGRLM